MVLSPFMETKSSRSPTTSIVGSSFTLTRLILVPRSTICFFNSSRQWGLCRLTFSFKSVVQVYAGSSSSNGRGTKEILTRVSLLRIFILLIIW